MSKITIYRFTIYDIGSDDNHLSHRWGTMEGIKRIGGQALADTATEVDASVLTSGIPGLSERDFDPHKRTGDFQRTVTS